MKRVELLNPKKEELTVDKLKELIGHLNYTDEQLQEFMFTIKVLASLIMEYQLLIEEENNEIKIAA